MQMPLDIKEVLQAAADTEAARNMPISICLLLDPDSPEDLRSCIVHAFNTKAPAARVSVQDYPTVDFSLDYRTDLAVLVAGFSPRTGELALSIRNNGVPVMVVTSMPSIVRDQALASGCPLLEDDMIAPSVEVDGSILPPDHVLNCEPFPLTIDRTRVMLDRMGEWIVSTFREKRLAFALAFQFVRRPLSMDFVNATAVQNAGVGLVVVIPGADLPVMTLNQAKMILQIAAAYDQELGKERILELLAVVGGGFACRAVARQIVAAVPAFGWAVKAGVGFSGTVAMGYAAISYFEALRGAGMKPVDAVAIAREEMAKIQAVIRGKQNPADAAFAAAKILCTDIGGTVIERGKALVPVALSAVSEVCAASNIKPIDLGKRAFTALLQSRK